jgi:hypothetical protein
VTVGLSHYRKNKDYGNRVLRIFGPKREKVMGIRKILHNEELRNLYSSTNIIKVIKLRKMRWAGHLSCVAEMRNEYKILI